MPDRQVQSINPATGEVIESFTPLTHAAIETALENASERFRTWRNVSLDERAELLNRAADVLETKAAEYARDITLEMGKTYREAMGEVVYGAGFIEWSAEEAKRIHGETLATPSQRLCLGGERSAAAEVGELRVARESE